jgi:hypothetical protein
MGSSTKGTLKFIVLNSETTFKDSKKVKNYIDPFVKVRYGTTEVRSIYGNSFEARGDVKAAKPEKLVNDEAKGIYR